MKKVLISLFIFVLILFLSFVGLFLYSEFRPVVILKDVKVYRQALGGYFGINHALYYRNQKIGHVSAVDSWYVQDYRVYGSLTNDTDLPYEVYYFYIDPCRNEVYITPYPSEFDNFLDEREISQDKRSYMSGNNVIAPYQHPYNKEITCPKD